MPIAYECYLLLWSSLRRLESALFQPTNSLEASERRLHCTLAPAEVTWFVRPLCSFQRLFLLPALVISHTHGLVAQQTQTIE